jgi:hypothetical protein
MASRKYYRFLDTVIDVYFGIILFTLFYDFPGFDDIGKTILSFHLMLFMLFTWWEFRTIEQIPKHYFFDFVLLGLEMFAFTQAVVNLGDLHSYLGWLVVALVIDIADGAMDWFIHKPKKEERFYLKFFLIDDSILAILYTIAFFVLDELTILSALVVSLPLVASIFLSVVYKVTELKARYET